MQYRCYFLDGADHIKAAENMEADTLHQAIELAFAMLKKHPQHHAVELWQGSQKVYPVCSA
jgi:hypothetical protein